MRKRWSATKSFAHIPLAARMSITQALDAAAGIVPGLACEFDAEFVDRGGRNVGTIRSVDGVSGADDRAWGVWLNGRVAGSLRQVAPERITPFGMTDLEPGDSTTLPQRGRCIDGNAPGGGAALPPGRGRVIL